MKAKSKSIIISLFIVTTILVFLTLSIVSIATPNLSKEIKKDLGKGVQSLCQGDIKNYYNMYNTRKLTEIEKTKFYEKIIETQDVINSEMDLFKKYKLSIQIKDVSIIDKIGDNLFLCNINVNYKYRKKHDTTATIDNTEDYIIKVIDVGNMDYKILLPFNSLDKDFSSSGIYKILKESNAQKEAERIKKEREMKEELEEQKRKEEEMQQNETEHNAHIIENISDADEDTLKEDNTQEEDSSSNNSSNNTIENSNNNTNNTTINNEDKSSFESFLED